MCDSCQHCSNGMKFGFDRIVSMQKINDMFRYSSCGIVPKDLFIGLLLGIFEKTSNPVLFLQKRVESCKYAESPAGISLIADKYSRYESTAYYHTLNKLCNLVREHLNSPCEKCKKLEGCIERDARVTDIIMEHFKIDISVDDFQKKCNEIIPDLKPQVKKDKQIYYIQYVCPVTGYYELAFPVLFKRQLMGVLISGQMKNDSEVSSMISIKDHIAEYTNNDDIKNGKYMPSSEADKVIKNMIQSLSDLHEALMVLTENKLKEHIHFVQLKAYEILTQFGKQNPPDYNDRGYYTKLLDSLKQKIKDAIEVICNELEIDKITIFSKERINGVTLNDTMILMPNTYYRKGVEKNDLWVSGVTTKVINPLEDDNVVLIGQEAYDIMLGSSIMPDLLTNQIDALSRAKNGLYLYGYGIKHSEFPILILMNWNDACHIWHIDEKIFSVLQKEFSAMLQGLANLVRSFAIELQSSFYANQMISFTTTMRHEIGQQSVGMRMLFNEFDQCNAKLFDDMGWISLPYEEGEKLRNHKETVLKFTRNFSDYVDNVTMRLTSSRYWNGIPEPLYTYFRPYREFLFKWNSIFRGECIKKGLLLNVPRIESNDLMRPRMYADKTMIEQVAYNLTNNAIKYSYPNTVISVDCRLSEDKEFYELVVINYGSLISEDDKEKIYEYGQRGSNTLDFSGQGIGLFISKSIASKHNGTLSHTSEPICDYNLPLIEAYLKVHDNHADPELKKLLKKEQDKLAEIISEALIPAEPKTKKKFKWLKHNISTPTAKTTFIFRIPNILLKDGSIENGKY